MRFGAFFLSQAPAGLLAPGEVLRQEVRQMQLAEHLGFDSVWVAEHHQSSYCVVPEVLTYAAHIAAVTSRIRIGLAVSVLTMRHPLDFAERAAFVDVISNGRLDVGVGRGYSQAEFATYGIPLEERRPRFEEALDIVTRAWTEEGFDHDSRFWNLKNVSIYPRPVQEPYPPLFGASSGSRGTVAAIARRGMPLLLGDDFLTPRKAAVRFAIYREQADALGRSPEQTNAAIADSWIAQKAYIASTTAEAREFAKPYIEWRHRKVKELMPAPPPPTLMRKIRRRSDVVRAVLSTPSMKEPNELTGDDLVKFELFGTPDDCIQRLRDFEDVGARNVIVSFSYGGMPDAAVRRSMELFAREVMPVFERSSVAA